MGIRRIVSMVLRICFLLFIIAVVILEFPGSRDVLKTPYSGIETKNLVVQNVEEAGPNAGNNIQRGDEIFAIDGVRVRNFNHYRYLVHANRDFSSQQYTIHREGETIDVVVDYAAIPTHLIRKNFAYIIVAFTFLLVGVLVYLRRSDLLGGLFALNCTLIAFLLTDRPVVASPHLQLFGELFHDLAILGFPVVFLNFFLIFPDWIHPIRGRKKLFRSLFLFAIPLVIYLVDCYLVIRQFFFMPKSEGIVTLILAVTTLYIAAYLVASLVIFIRNYVASPSAQKRRLRIVIAGTVAGIVPFLAVLVWRQISPGTYTLGESISVLCLAFISISFAYAILKHGAIELYVVMRKSLVYAFLTGAIIAVYYMVVHMLGDFFTREFNLSRSGFTIFAILVLSIVFAPARDRVQRLVDRVFFRGDYVYKEEVVEFNRQLSKKLGRDDIFNCLFDRVERLLGPSYVAIYTKRGQEDFSLEKATGASPSLPKTITANSFLARYFSRYRKPLMVEYLDKVWEQRNFDSDSRAFLTATKAAVCLPIVSLEDVIGFVLLGEKRSELPYSRADAELLQTFAEHLGVVLDNATLHEATMEQERLMKEVLVARDIQLSLLPKAPPRHPSIDIVGQMLSSREVGGDYFDYFLLDSNNIALAVGDVSGKGIPAAMLMFSLQAVFKNIALKDQLPPGELTEALNRYLCENAESGQFATFFYGVIDLKNSMLRFSNAGHCPPLLVKRDYTDRLSEGGMMLGVERDRKYKEGRVQINVGDLVCLYTDGITEQKKSDTEEEFGESRLIEFFRVNKFMPPESLQEALFDQVTAFGGGRQDDDITTVIAHYKGS
ncbi:MAG: SpoIIE family protein phosphatase [Candidatus Latescibacteria bacterium]|nr:SpoIIE family protein phosphatase [Candidatus Latescibacterota bacterium]NIM21469.1 SpoIIE family protein phosphatase [Candidatus Latescibacterota bacterium]NIM65640.1 SpoIIE family protein phosphatase [Candidatus Latescibacterota bacterium]NIO02022.1 SpoIIE family protein phosphatase [Candidatus Latescibacterota bacterium]NIO28834.1 SpoIIE family protein phosphatase [Candidatus Latescibacterota bacterium]